MEVVNVVLNAVGLVASAALFGGMLIFAGFFAPLVFAKLPEETATSFMREIFPKYYMFMVVVAAIAAVNLAPIHHIQAGLLGMVCAGFLLARFWLMPLAHRFYDARQKGEYGAADQFANIHRRGAFLNMVQFVIVLGVIVSLA